MPELPEVESVRRGLMSSPVDAPIIRTWRSDKALRTTGAGTTAQDFARLVGGRLQDVQRRGKYLLWRIELADGAMFGLLLHLGMSGRFGVAPSEVAMVAHTHLVIGLANGIDVRLVDPRRFGAALVAPYAELSSSGPLAELGPEPFDRALDVAFLIDKTSSIARPIRDALLDQTLIAGIGNIYACEALHAAHIHPLQPARDLGRKDWQRLLQALRDALQRGIDNGGTTLKDFRNVSGEVGRNQDDLRVYGRRGQRCNLCQGTIAHGSTGGRSYFYCSKHQHWAPK